jgi:hypothetical protein
MELDATGETEETHGANGSLGPFRMHSQEETTSDASLVFLTAKPRLSRRLSQHNFIRQFKFGRDFNSVFREGQAVQSRRLAA